MNVDTRELRWFQQVADGVTVTEVSALEYVSQPAVSRALARLDHEVGAPLLQRSGRTLRMTRAGASFKTHVDALLHQLDDGLAAVQQLIDPETGTVTLSFQASLGTWLVPDLVRSFRAEHPSIRFDLQTKADELRPSVSAGSVVDLELSTLQLSHSEHTWRTLAREPLRLLLPADHRLAGGRAGSAVALREVRDEPFVLIRPSSLLHEQTQQLCRAAGFEPSVAFVVDDLPTIGGYVAAGLGVAVVPGVWETAVVPNDARIRHVALADPAASRDIALAWSTERRMLPAAALFRDHVVDRAHTGQLPLPLPASPNHPHH